MKTSSKLSLILALTFVFSQAQGTAAVAAAAASAPGARDDADSRFPKVQRSIVQDAPRHTLTARFTNEHGCYTITSAGLDSIGEYVRTLKALPLKDGYPPVEDSAISFKVQNLNRQVANNPHHLFTYVWQATANEGEAKVDLGFAQYGMMPSKSPGYKEDLGHGPITEKYISLGVVKRKNDKDPSLNDGNIDRIDNHGISFVLPLFRANATPEQRAGAIKTFHPFVCMLKNDPLPTDGTYPHVVMSLFHPSDPNIGLFEAAGFAPDGNEGFGLFYPRDGVPQPRVMVTKKVEVAAPKDEGAE